MRSFLSFVLLGCILMSGYELAEVAAKVTSTEEKHDSAKSAISAAIEKSLEDIAEDKDGHDEFKLDQGAVEEIAQKLVQAADENEDAYDLEDPADTKDAAHHKAKFWWGRRRRRLLRGVRSRKLVGFGGKAYCCGKNLWWCCIGKK